MSAQRLAFARAALVLAFVVLAARAAHLSVFDQRGAQRGEAQTLRTLTLAPERGSILDRDGSGLALTVEAPSVYAIGREVNEPVAAARLLSRELGIDRATMLRSLETREGFQFVRRWVGTEQAERILSADIDGIGIVQEPRRIYPHKGLAARLVGFANIDGDGVRGIEQREDAWLRGTTRRLPIERDGFGRALIMNGETTWGTAGGDISLTLDAALQSEAERALREEVERTGARGGVLVAMDPHTGEILSLAEWPTFDPNRFRETPYAATRSGAFLDAVEAGSSMKAFLVAAALERGALRPDEIIDTEGGRYRVPGKTITDHHDYGLLYPAGALGVSSNVAAVKIGFALGPRAHYEMLRAFGFGNTTGSRFPDESAGVLRHFEGWKPLDHATIAFGQGISVTAIQLAVATSVLANGGHLVRPRTVAARRAPGGPWHPTRAEIMRRVISRDTAEAVVSMLENVVTEEGTGTRAALAGVRVAGKTGTAQKWDPEGETYSQSKFRAWFIGIAPADAPRIVIVSQLDEPKRPQHTGGMAAAPLFARVAAGQLARYGVFVESESVQLARREAEATSAAAVPKPTPRPEPPAVAAAPAPSRAPLVVAASTEAKPTPDPEGVRPEAPVTPKATPTNTSAFRGRVFLPDLRGLSRNEVMQVTAANGLQATLEGDGTAVRQHPPPGSVVAGSDTVRIEFSGPTPQREAGPDVSGAADGDRG
jgi:cell division protein FtsI (penicillin-binding protein 3)